MRFEGGSEGLNLLLLFRGWSIVAPPRQTLACDRRILCSPLVRLFLDPAMRLEILVEQHRVHLVVADGKGFPLVIAHDQIGANFCHLLSDQAKCLVRFNDQ